MGGRKPGEVAFESAFLCCVKVCGELSTAARKLHDSGSDDAGSEDAAERRKQEKKITAVLLMLRSSAKRALLSFSGSDLETPAGHLSRSVTKALSTAVGQSLGLSTENAEAMVLQRREDELAAELESIAVAWDPFMGHAGLAGVLAVVTSLRHLEQSTSFQSRLAADVDALTGEDSSYSEDNFAYGFTTFTSWLQVFHHPDVASAVAAAMSTVEAEAAEKEVDTTSGRDGRSEPCYMVWGSSTGSLVLYAALTFGWKSKGYELLPCLVEAARELQKKYSIEGVSFVAADMLESEVQDVGVVFLTNQCWDRSLMLAAAQKLSRELTPGALVIDYSGSLDGEAAFEALTQVAVPVSWADSISMHVYRRRA